MNCDGCISQNACKLDEFKTCEFLQKELQSAKDRKSYRVNLLQRFTREARKKK